MLKNVLSRGALAVVVASLALATGAVTANAAPAAPTAAVSPTALGTIGPGDSGSAVKLWQKDLNLYMKEKAQCRPTLSVDGEFGTKTTNATTCFQRVKGLDDDGIVGPKTRGKMCSFLFDSPAAESVDLYINTCT